jgi:putative peptidoglycan lipid II flippase
MRGTAVVGGITLLSRILGFVRDSLVARLFGSSPIADAFFVAFRIPNLLRSFVAEGAMTSAFVPVLTSELAKSKEAARAAMRSIVGILLLATCTLTALGILFAPQVIHLIAPGFGRDPEQFALCAELTQMMMPYVVFISLVALLGGALNAVGIFGTAAMAQVWMNLSLIAGALVAEHYEARTAAIVLAASVVLGGMVQIATQLPALKRSGLSLIPQRPFLTPPAKQMLALMGPALVGATVYQLGMFLSTVFASVLEPGSVSWLFYADRLVQLPIGIFSIALASVLLPALSHARARGDDTAFQRELVQALRSTSFVIIPVSVGLYFFAAPLTALVFERGAFDAHATLMTAEAIKAYTFGIWAMSCHSMLMRAFIARKDTKTPVRIGILSLTCVVLASVLLMGAPYSGGAQESSWALAPLVAAQQAFASLGIIFSLGHDGLAAASSIGSWVAFIAAAVLLSRRLSLPWRDFWGGSLLVAVISLFAVGAASYATSTLNSWQQLLFGSSGAVALFLLLAWLLRIEELRLVMGRIRAKMRR